MFLRVFSFLLLIVVCTSCDKLSFTKNKNNLILDTVVDFSSVDVFPSFKVCDSFIDKAQKTNCFRETIHQKIGEELQKHTFVVQDSISEIVLVNLIINKKGVVVLDEISASKSIEEQLPNLDSLLKVSVKKLPVIYPAIKRGIPVTTKYQLPIRIQL